MTLIDVLKNQSNPVKLIAPHLSFDFYKKINLSENYLNINSIDSNSSRKLAIHINDFLDLHNKKIAYGGYLEKRSLYKRSSHFGSVNKKNERNIHLGIDLWSSAGTLVLAAFNGTIHSFKNNINLGDYGPTIILKHMLQGIEFYTLYGHLSKNDLNSFKEGDKILASSVIGSLGSMKENGDYPPHLHFQIILDIENFYGDYPGVCSENDLKYYSQNCPDPNLVLKLSSF
jgi:murein DD-endopeptidase MepM/ murein hydrolase activator NlpD|tara:strand:- start:59 stop:745 length:687 start_codon:yes stop_codon:yes gene_type:complete